MHSWLTNR